MKYGTRFKQGEILLVPFPYTNLSHIKQRPALVISKNEYNEKKPDLIICGITSQIKEGTEDIIITTQDLEQGNLPKISLIKIDKIFTIEKDQVRKSIGKINTKTWEKVKQEFYKLI